MSGAVRSGPMDTAMPARGKRDFHRAHSITAVPAAPRPVSSWDWPALLAYCHAVARRCTDSPFDAEDAAQEAAARAWRYRAQCRKQPDPRGWLAAIVRREVARLGAERSRAAESPVAEMPDVGESCPLIAEAAERLWVRAALAELPARERRVISLRYEDDLTQPGIAQRLGVPEGTVKIRLHRARASLRERLAEDRQVA